MSKKSVKLPTEAEMAFYRSKAVDGSYLGKNQLASIFAAYDDVADKLKKANTLLFMAETALGPRTTPGRERVCAARALMNAMRDAGYNVDPL